MPSIRDIYRSSETLAAQDLPPGVQVPAVIEAVRACEFDDGNKLEIRFRGKVKVLMANKTNAMRIADQHGDDFDQWPGKLVYLMRDKTEFKGQQVECVRVSRTPPPVQQASTLQPPAPPAPVGVPAQQTKAALEDAHTNPADIPF